MIDKTFKSLLPLTAKGNLEQATQGVYAWYDGHMIDRPPVQCSDTNNEDTTKDSAPQQWKEL